MYHSANTYQCLKYQGEGGHPKKPCAYDMHTQLLYTHTCTHVHMPYIHMHMHARTCIHTCTCMHTHVYTHVYTHVHACTCMHIHVYTHAIILLLCIFPVLCIVLVAGLWLGVVHGLPRGNLDHEIHCVYSKLDVNFGYCYYILLVGGLFSLGGASFNLLFARTAAERRRANRLRFR